MFKRLNNETKLILEQVISLAYYSNGSISYERILYGMSYLERDLLSNFIEKRLEEKVEIMNKL